ncbi:MAG: carbohydrate ABC transporter permease [Armatimonadetes bacterium]|nr:carbohydrate ABC transporter permease [Armatimonadota bacterium]
MRFGAMILISLFFLYPLMILFSASLRQPGLAPPRTVEFIPNPISWANYIELFELLPFGKYLINSLIVTVIAIPLTLIVASLAGYATARLEPKPRQTMIYAAIAMQLIPVTALWLPRFLIFKWLGLINSFGSLLMPVLLGSAPIFMLLYTRACMTIPTSLYEAAELDGASPAKIWWRIAMPLARPTTMAVSSLTFVMYWGDYINPLLYLKSQKLFTLPVGLQQLQQLDKSNWPLLMAASTILVLPALVMFLLIQRFFLQESRLGGTSGY